jgi:hypothetical protein
VLPGVAASLEPAVSDWYSTAPDLLRFLATLRDFDPFSDEGAILYEDEAQAMLQGGVGWHKAVTTQGVAYYRGGNLSDGSSPTGGYGASAAIVHMPSGYDGVLLVNTSPVDAAGVLIDALESLPPASDY